MKYLSCLVAFGLVLSAGCSKPAEAPVAAPTETKETPTETDDHGHTHAPPHGGALVELGDHAANIEIVIDEEAGRMTLYALDAHAENPVRMSDASIAVMATPEGGAMIDLVLKPRENPLTGEKVGDTSEFFVESPQLKGLTTCDIIIPSVRLQGVEFKGIAFTYPEGLQ